MEQVIQGRKPASVFRYFEQISAIPRGSYNEEKIADYLERFAAERNFECYRDALHNVFIKAPASKGRESEPPLMLQGHTDMVCEKNNDVVHDFTKDPLKLYVENGFLRAKGTTLGGDDGIAVAMMLALLDGEIESHPAYECLFTAAEEAGLDGALGFDYSLVRARRMLNLDNEDLGVVTGGCAGGFRSDLSLRFDTEPTARECCRVQIKGLMGGHSGVNINSGRANANKLMGRVLAALRDRADIRLVSVTGGSKDNAIPRECEAILATENAQALYARVEALHAQIKQELSEEDQGFCLSCEAADGCGEMLSEESTQRVIAVMNCVANGVLKMSEQVKGLVEWSRNQGVIRTEAGAVVFTFSTRSSIEAQLDAAERELNLIAELTGGEVSHHSRYPGWSYAPVSPLRDAYLQTYQEVIGEEATVDVIHAGLECGVIRSHLPDMDMISIGPDLRDIHSPDEAMDLDSVERFWLVLEALIRKKA